MKPYRSCILCKNKIEKEKLARFVADENNEAQYDNLQKINARGIYLCKNKNCLEKCIKLIEKNKMKIKISVEKESLKKAIQDVENELGE